MGERIAYFYGQGNIITTLGQQRKKVLPNLDVTMETPTELQQQVSSGPPDDIATIQSHRTATTSLRWENTTSLLRYLYADLRRISQVASPAIILHAADRSLSSPAKDPIRGIDAVQAHEERLVAATGGMLQIEVHSISANEHFGAVLGTLRTGRYGQQGEGDDHEIDQAIGSVSAGAEISLAMPFCGLWRFVDGKAVEHWENAADPARLAHWLTANSRR